MNVEAGKKKGRRRSRRPFLLEDNEPSLTCKPQSLEDISVALNLKQVS